MAESTRYLIGTIEWTDAGWVWTLSERTVYPDGTLVTSKIDHGVTPERGRSLDALVAKADRRPLLLLQCWP